MLSGAQGVAQAAFKNADIKRRSRRQHTFSRLALEMLQPSLPRSRHHEHNNHVHKHVLKQACTSHRAPPMNTNACGREAACCQVWAACPSHHACMLARSFPAATLPSSALILELNG